MWLELRLANDSKAKQTTRAAMVSMLIVAS